MSAWSSESPTTRQVGQWVGCEDDDGLIVVHPERETCAVCQQASPVSTSAESPANTPVEPAGASEPPSWMRVIRAKHAEDMRATAGRHEDAKRQHAVSSLTVSQVGRLLSSLAPVSPVEPTAPTQAGRIDQTPFVDTPVKQAKRRAFDDPTIANLDALADAALSVGSKPLRDALERIRTITQGVAPAEAINAVAEVWSISRDALSMRTHQ